MEIQRAPPEMEPNRRFADNRGTRRGSILPFYYRRRSDKVFMLIFGMSVILFNYYSLHDLKGEADILRIVVFFGSLVFGYITRAVAVSVYSILK